MDAAVLVAGPPLGETGPSQIVLIDASVPDAGKVAAGVAPGVTAALLDPNGDEAGQIADYLTSRCIAGLAVIDIVSNDSDCTISPGSSVLDAGTIAANAKDLAAIGAALAPNVPFGCSAATWRRTRAMSRFLPDPHRREPQAAARAARLRRLDPAQGRRSKTGGGSRIDPRGQGVLFS